MKNKAFIFDWSGTLSDSFHLFCKVCDLMLAEFGVKPISPAEIKSSFDNPYMKFWNKHLPELTKEKQDILYKKYIHQVGEAAVYENSKEIISYLHDRGYKIFIVSSDPTLKLLPEIEKSGFSKLITKVISEIHEKKYVIVSLIDDFSLDKEQTFYVGDTSGDVEAGKFAGVKTIGATWGFQDREKLAQAKPDFLLDNLIEIKNIII